MFHKIIKHNNFYEIIIKRNKNIYTSIYISKKILIWRNTSIKSGVYIKKTKNNKKYIKNTHK